MNQNPWWRRLRLWAIVAVIFALVIAGLRLWPDDNGAGPTGSDPTEHCVAGDRTVEPCDTIPAEAKCESNLFNSNSLPSTDKVWGDSVSTPHKSKTPSEAFAEDRQEICGNLTLFKAWVDLFKNVPLVWGVNPWMGEANAKVEESGSDLNAAFLSADGVHVTPQFTRWAEKMNTILLDYKPVGLKPWMTFINMHIPLGSTEAGKSPIAVENPDQEDLPSWIMVYTEKDDDCPDPKDPGAVIGSNDDDKRPELFLPRCLPPTEEPPCTDCPPDTVPPTTVPCPDKKDDRLADKSCGLIVTPTPRDTSSTTTHVIISTSVPVTAPAETTPVTPTTHDFVPPAVTTQDPNGPPVQGTPPSTVASQPTAPP